MRSKQDIYNLSILLIEVVGEKFRHTSKTLQIFRTVNCAILLFLFVLVFLNIFHTEEGMYTQSVESNLIIFHVSDFQKHPLNLYDEENDFVLDSVEIFRFHILQI